MDKSLHDMTDELLVKFLLQETSILENSNVLEWLSKSPANKKYFNDFQLIWNESKKLEQDSTINEDEAWQRFKQRTALKKIPVRKLSYKYLLRIAAVFLLGTATTWLGYTLLKKPVITKNELITFATKKESSKKSYSQCYCNA